MPRVWPTDHPPLQCWDWIMVISDQGMVVKIAWAVEKKLFLRAKVVSVDA